MKRLTGLDAGFLSMETRTSAMHVAGLAIYDPTDSAGGTVTVDDVKDMVRSRLHLAPPFRQRLVEVPFQLHFPLWIEDPDFDLDNHIRRVAVPAPGGTRELDELAAELDAIQLDRSRPLWEMWFIEGLEGGRVATLTKVHHAAMDGASGSEITVALFDLTPEVTEHPVAEPWEPDPVPSDIEMLTYATRSLIRQPIGVLKALRRTARAALDVRSLTRSLAEASDRSSAPLPFTAPPTSINGAITSSRAVTTATLSLTDVKRVKNAFGTTVNDVVLALCAGTLRRYFERLDEAVDGPLLAMVPVSVRTEDQKTDMGNKVSSMFASLATDVEDPVQRLAAIHEGMRGAKEQHQAIGADTLTDWAEFAAPAVFGRAMRLYARMGLADRHRPIFNLTISNVPGPPFPLYSAGAKLVANYPLGPIMDGAAVNITVMSLEDSLDFGILACPDAVDDVQSLADGLQTALDELLAAADATSRDSGGSAGAVAAAAPATGAARKKATVERVIAKRATAKRSTSKRATAKKRPATAKAAAKTTASKTTATKTAAKKRARRAGASKAGAKRSTATTSTTEQASARPRKASAKKTTAKQAAG